MSPKSQKEEINLAENNMSPKSQIEEMNLA
jgi:hypothetical protein